MFKFVADRDEADADLRIYIRREDDADSPGNPKVKADMWLINKVGYVVTPTDNGATAWKYKGKLKDMPDKIVSDIKGLAKAAKEETQEKQPENKEKKKDSENDEGDTLIALNTIN